MCLSLWIELSSTQIIKLGIILVFNEKFLYSDPSIINILLSNLVLTVSLDFLYSYEHFLKGQTNI
jgi:hypothetical protein